MVEYRTLNENEMDSAQKLWGICFQEDSKEFIDYYFANCVCSGSFIGAFLDGKLVAMLQIKEYDQEFRGNSITTGYLVGICTDPGHRMQGYAKELILKSFDIMKSKGIAFSSLYPFNYPFYKKFGYAICSEKQIITINKEQFGQIDTKLIEVMQLTKDDCEEAACELLNSYYAFFSRLSGYIIRDEESMKVILLRHLASERSSIVVAKEKGQIIGYALCTTTDKGVVADEVVYKNIKAFAAIADYLRDGKNVVNLTVPPYDKIHLYMDDPVGCVSIEPHIMQKILDVTESIPLLELKGQKESIYVKITNIAMPDSFEIYKIDECGIIKEANSSKWDFECDNGVYMQLLSGYISCGYAYKKGLIKVNNYEHLRLFQQILPEKSMYVFEMF